ncbi:MAG: FAD-dependent oxidoreductase [Actinobacteria bacterium]|nr:FAD-dependent oxidoreductase [Actinomycetota bacterium]
MGTLHETNPSLWAATTRGGATYPSLVDDPAAGEGTFDVAVVGAGITGLSTALAMVEAGATVVVLEAGRISSGVTGYTTAKLTSLHGLTYAGAAASHGDDVARLYGQANEAAIVQVADWVQRHGIDCDFSRRDAFTYTTSADQVASIEHEVEVARRLGLPASFTTRTELPYEVAGAIRFENQAQFHPRAYCLGLAAAILAGGGRIYERTTVTDVDEGSPCTLETSAWDVKADQVVLATHLPFLDRGGFFAKCHPTRSYALSARLSGPVPTGMYLSADSPTRSVRAAEGDTVVILGGEGHKVGQDEDTRRRYAALESWARQAFDVEAIDFRWSAQDYSPVDGLPFVGRQLPGSKVFVATGFKKWGMSNGTAAAMMLAAEISGRENPWQAAFDATRQREPLTSRDLVSENVNVAKQFMGDRLATLAPPAADTLASGEGGIVSLDGDKVAGYRDDDGLLHAVSPVCRHLGCLVTFNTAERTWDCPCHGSRYTVDGEVIQGPATRDLERKTPPG